MSSNLHLWLSPAVVSDFDIHDFDFLPNDERTELEKLVEDFKEITQEANPIEQFLFDRSVWVARVRPEPGW